MNNLVYLEPNKIDAVPFTTSDIIAKYAKIDYRSVQRIIETHLERLESFGIMRFEITLLRGRGRPKKKYKLNEQQATLLITFLKNTDIVADFKTELVRQFYLMREELFKRRINRQELKPIRRELTDVIQEKEPDNKWAYKHFTDLGYKSVMGKSARQIRQERNALPKATAIDYMTSQEIQAVTKVDEQITVLIDLGLDYYQIKDILEQKVRAKLSA